MRNVGPEISRSETEKGSKPLRRPDNAKGSRLRVFLLLTILSAAILGGWFGQRVRAGPPLEEETQKLLRSFTETLAIVESEFAHEPKIGDLLESTIRGLLRSLDPHSSFFSRTDYKLLREGQQGKYYGLGITIRPESPGNGRIVVVAPPVSGTPAYKVGIRAGDVISKIEGESIQDWNLREEVIPKLKGPKGTIVHITIERPGEPEPIEMSVQRGEIPLYTIKYVFHLDPTAGYIKIEKFSETTSKELDEALEKLKESELEALVLDLRDNPGGALGQAIKVADRFLEKGQLVVKTRTRRGKAHEYLAPRGRRHDYPMVVLINQNSASASEIVAGALQDHDRALIVGETSFGKALVQTIYPLEGNRGLALTTGKYYTPSDRLIQRNYSDSFYAYFRGGRRQQSDQSERTEYQTDTGRTVYGRGGITPDEEVTSDRSSKLLQQIRRKRLFQKFAERLADGEIVSDIRFHYTSLETAELTREDKARLREELVISEKTLVLFQEFLETNLVEFTKTSLEEDRPLIENSLKQRLFARVLDDEEGKRASLEVDQQLQRAVQLLPKARALFQTVVAKKQADSVQ